MKRKIKYIGGAIAVALLAAGSPVIMPRLTQEISVKAADSEKTELTANIPELKSTIGTWDAYGGSDDKTDSLSSTFDVYLEDKNKNKINGSDVSFEKDDGNIVYYDSKSDALSGEKTRRSRYITKTQANGEAFFVRNQMYYRRVTFKLGDVNSYSFGGDNTDHIIDTDNNTVTYIQSVEVTGPKATATIPDLNVDAGVEPSAWPMDNKLSLQDDDGNSVGTVLSAADQPKVVYVSADGAYEEDPNYEIKFNSLEAGKDYYREVRFSTIKKGEEGPYYDVSGKLVNGYPGKYYSGAKVNFIQKVHVTKANVGNPLQTVNVTKGDDATYVTKPVSVKGNLTSDGKNVGISDIHDREKWINRFYVNPNEALNGSDNSVDGVVSNMKFTKSGTFYRSFTYTMNSDIDNYDFEGEPDVDYKIGPGNNQITYIQKIEVHADKITPKIPSVSIQVGVPTSTIDDKTDNLSLTKDDNDNSEVSQSVGILPKMLDSDSNYVAYFKSTDDIPDSISGDDSAAEVKDGSAFTKAGTYYRMVGFAVNKADAEKYDFNDTADGQKPIIDDTDDQTTYVLYPQKVIVNAKPTSSSSNSKTWTYKSASGIVTTKNNKQVYLLKNQDNKQIENRGLAKNTAWRIDEVRTNQAGDKQYRVATGEWVNADDVVLGSTNNNSDWTYTSVEGVVTTKDAHEYYVLYDQNNKLISNRGLAKDTSWKTNGYRTNQAGDKQYRVATNEWINNEDVDFHD